NTNSPTLSFPEPVAEEAVVDKVAIAFTAYQVFVEEVADGGLHRRGRVQGVFLHEFGRGYAQGFAHPGDGQQHLFLLLGESREYLLKSKSLRLNELSQCLIGHGAV